MNIITLCDSIFKRAIDDYHLIDNIDAEFPCPYDTGTLECTLYIKCMTDTIQWHLEDVIRDTAILPADALKLKRRIDRSNQDRTDIVEEIDNYFLDKYRNIVAQPDATLNTESPAWAIDRLSILYLKIYHMREQVERKDVSVQHIQKCETKLKILLEQQNDLSLAICQLLEDIGAGRKYMKVYRQMKMYNDPSTNPVLYRKCLSCAP